MDFKYNDCDVLNDENDDEVYYDSAEAAGMRADTSDAQRPARNSAQLSEKQEEKEEEMQPEEAPVPLEVSPRRESDIPEEVEEPIKMFDTPPLLYLPATDKLTEPLSLPPPKTPVKPKSPQKSPHKPKPEVRRSTRILANELSKLPPDTGFSAEGLLFSADEYEALSLLTAFTAEEKSNTHVTPKSHRQAAKSKDKTEWHAAEVREITAHIINGTFELVPMPEKGTDEKNHVLMKSLWKYRIKTQQNVITNYKARLCTDGQYVVVSPDKAFAGTPLQTSINSVFGLAGHFGVKVMSGDIPAAYVQAPIPDGDTVYYVTQPEGHVNLKYPNHVWRLNKCLYGIPISGNLWNATFSKFLMEIGMVRCKSDPAVFYMRDKTGIIVMPVVVDDTLDISTSESLRKFIHEKMIERFKWKDLGECSWYLGCRVLQDFTQISIDQTAYLKELLRKFEHLGIHNANVPADPLVSLLKCESTTTEFPYSEVIGSLIWLVKTRPEIAYAVSMCARHLSAHNATHDSAALRVLGYLKKYPNRGIGYKMNPNPDPEGIVEISMFSDSSWADNVSTRKSSYGYFNLLRGHPISWRSKLTPSVASGVMSAEYCSDSEAVREAMFTIQFYGEMGIPIKMPINVYGDNQAAQDYAKVQKVTQLSKHMQVKWHLVREQYELKNIDVPWIASEKNLADIMTKALGLNKFNLIQDVITVAVTAA
jgi:hypothetical protein